MVTPFEVHLLDVRNVQLAEQALQLQLAAHHIEAQWLCYPALPLMWPDLPAVIACSSRVWGAFEGDALRGILVLKPGEDGSSHIERLVVDPTHFNEGWGYRLLNCALEHEYFVTTDTGQANLAALALYEKAGFIKQQAWALQDGLSLWRLVYQPPVAPEFALAEDGWLIGASHVYSPNCDTRPPDAQPELLVIHNISLPPYRYGGPAVEQLFTNTLEPEAHPFYAEIAHLRVSSHFFIRRDGLLTQFVSTRQRAWHAGVSSWQGRTGCNDFSLGVELEGCDFELFSEAQYRTLMSLVRALKAQLPLRAITGHEHIAPGRKTDPGPFFDWTRLGLSSGLPIHLTPS